MSNSRVKEGELYKYRNVFYGWKKYWFRLERSYLHYFEGQYNAEPKGTIARGEMAQVTFPKDYQTNFGFEIHLKNSVIWHLQATTHEERMEWMRALQPDAYIVDPLKAPVVNATTTGDAVQPSAPPQNQGMDEPFSDPNYTRIYPQLPGTSCRTAHEGHAYRSPVPDSPPPAYDEIDK